MDFKEVKELIEIIDKSQLRVFELSLSGCTVKMSKNTEKEKVSEETVKIVSEPVQSFMQGEVEKEIAEKPIKEDVLSGKVVKAPLVGTFYSSPAPDKDNFVRVGDSVKKGDVLCIVEAMKVMNEVTSDFDGIVKAVLVEDETLVEYGQPLFTIG